MFVQTHKKDLVNLGKTEIISVRQDGEKFYIAAIWPGGEGELSRLTECASIEFCASQLSRITQGMIAGDALVVMETTNNDS